MRGYGRLQDTLRGSMRLHTGVCTLWGLICLSDRDEECRRAGIPGGFFVCLAVFRQRVARSNENTCQNPSSSQAPGLEQLQKQYQTTMRNRMMYNTVLGCSPIVLVLGPVPGPNCPDQMPSDSSKSPSNVFEPVIRGNGTIPKHH